MVVTGLFWGKSRQSMNVIFMKNIKKCFLEPKSCLLSSVKKFEKRDGEIKGLYGAKMFVL